MLHHVMGRSAVNVVQLGLKVAHLVGQQLVCQVQGQVEHTTQRRHALSKSHKFGSILRLAYIQCADPELYNISCSVTSLSKAGKPAPAWLCAWAVSCIAGRQKHLKLSKWVHDSTCTCDTAGRCSGRAICSACSTSMSFCQTTRLLKSAALHYAGI